MVAVPYTLDLNDSVIFAVEKHASSEQYDRLRHTLEAIEPELETAPRVLTISLHHHLLKFLQHPPGLPSLRS